MSTRSLTKFIRLSARDRYLILMGLSWIGANYHFWRSKGRYPNSRHDLVWGLGFDQGVYDQELMDRTLALHAAITSLKAGGRLRVETSIEFSICALAVRVAVTRHRHGHQSLDIAQVDSASASLLRRLETVRKRTKRSEVRLLGIVSYQQSAHVWRDFAKWLRVHLLDCSCKQKRRLPPPRSSPPRSYRYIVTQLALWARAELLDRKEEIPCERELRRLVSLALRYVRRGRTKFYVPDLLYDKVFASARLATFITIRMEKRSQFKDNK